MGFGISLNLNSKESESVTKLYYTIFNWAKIGTKKKNHNETKTHSQKRKTFEPVVSNTFTLQAFFFIAKWTSGFGRVGQQDGKCKCRKK